METIAIVLATLSTLITASFAFWSAANVERLKSQSAKEIHDLTSSFRTNLEKIKLEMDRARKAYETHVYREYDLYESVYPRLVDAYYSIIAFRALDSDPFIESILSEDEIKQRRSENLDRSDKLLEFISDVERKQAFIPPDVYSEIEKFWRMGVNTSMVRRFPSLFRPPFEQDLREASSEELLTQLKLIAMQIRRSLSIANS